MPEKSARSPVQRLAWRLLAEAQSYPPLIHRSENSSEATNGRSKRSFPAVALLSDPSLDIRQYLENLVSIAVGSAQQAEEMLFEVRKANKKARRRMAVVASVGALGMTVGIAGFIASRGANVRLSELRTEVGVLAKTAQDIASLQQKRKAEEAALAGQKAAREALQHQIADLQQQAISFRDQVARGSKVEPARAEADRLLQDTDPLQQHQMEQATSARQNSHWQQMALLPARRPPAPPLNLVSTPVQPIPVFMPEPGPSQQLLIARQWLARGRLDQARHVLAMIQTRIVLQPVAPDQPAARGMNALATDVANAIRWLDMGSNGEAMQALNQAVFHTGAN